MKLSTLLLSCLLLTAAFNLALDVARQARFASLTPALAPLRPSISADQAFDARLDHLTDPGLLREAARTERARRWDDDRLLAALLESVNRMNGAGLWRSGLLLALALGALVAGLRAAPDAPQNSRAN